MSSEQSPHIHAWLGRAASFSRSLQMPLLADGIGFRQPALDFRIHFRNLRHAKMVDMISARNGVNPSKARVFQSAREHHMTVHPARTRRHLRKRHAHLKSDARLFRQHLHRATAPDRLEHGLEDGPNLRRFSLKMCGQIVPSAKMRLIPVGEIPPATRALPQWAFGRFRHWKLLWCLMSISLNCESRRRQMSKGFVCGTCQVSF